MGVGYVAGWVGGMLVCLGDVLGMMVAWPQ